MNQEVVVEHDEGDIHAVKSARDEPWHIAAPWTDERFFGSVPECKARIKEIIALNQEETA